MWVWVLVAVILAIGLLLPMTGVFRRGDAGAARTPSGEIPPAPALHQNNTAATSQPLKPKVYAKLEPWRGLRQGMAQEEVRKLFGDPQKIRSYKGEDTWEIYDDAEGSGIFRSTGAMFGQWVVIQFDRTGKVVTYQHHNAEAAGKKPTGATAR